MAVFGFRLQREADYPPELHRATDRYERAVDACAVARHADEFNQATAELQESRQAYGMLLLALDKRRRPAFYATPSEEGR